MNLLAHQVKYARGYSDKAFLVHEGGTGKTVCACVWLADGRDDYAFVICPKKVVRKWQKALVDWKAKATVLSEREFKVYKFDRQPTALVVDEADEFAAPLFIASQQSDRGVALYRLIQAYPDMPVALLTATPIRSTPWNLHSLLCFYGHYIDWKKWREVFFYLQKPDNGEFQYLDRPTWLKTDDWREAVALVLAKYADIVNLRDCVGELPPATEEIIRVQTPKYKKGIDDVAFYSEHRWEQQNKVKEILEIGKEYRKVLVVAFYKEQLKELQAALSKDRETFLVDGSVKDQESVTEAAAKSDECFLIVQADIGAGFDGDTFSCVVFVSMSYAVRSFVQMKFRVRRIHNLHPVVYNFLIGGRCDQAIYDNVQMGKTFVPSEWIQHNAP